MKKLPLPSCLGFILLLLAAPLAAADVAPSTIAYTCNGCHAVGGLLPKLNGRRAKQLEQLLLDFKYQRKPSSIMGRISKGFTDSELKNVARYFSQLKDEQ